VSKKELREKMQAALMGARTICDEVDKAGREFSAEERQKVNGYLEEAKKAKDALKALEDDDALRKTVMDLGAGIEATQGAGPGQQAGKGKTIGEQFVESEAFKAWFKQVAPQGNLPEGKGRGITSPPVQFRSLFGRKTLITGDSDTSAGAFVQTDYSGIYEPLGRRPLVLRDLLAKRTTTSDLVQFVRQTAQVTQATPVAEANVTDYAGASGEVSGEKPEGAMAFEQVTTAVKTIAVWVPATKRALSDASQLRGIIDQELMEALDEELEDQLLSGDGDGENFTGILETSGVLSQAWDTDLLTTIRKARTTLAVTGKTRRPTAMLCHPNDAETLDLLKDDQGRFYFGGPSEGGVQQAWRVPVVECEGITEGTGLMGDYGKAVLWDRERAGIYVSDSHSDFFIRNMIAILGEMRAAFGVIRPSAFITVELTSGS